MAFADCRILFVSKTHFFCRAISCGALRSIGQHWAALGSRLGRGLHTKTLQKKTCASNRATFVKLFASSRGNVPQIPRLLVQAILGADAHQARIEIELSYNQLREIFGAGSHDVQQPKVWDVASWLHPLGWSNCQGFAWPLLKILMLRRRIIRLTVITIWVRSMTQPLPGATPSVDSLLASAFDQLLRGSMWPPNRAAAILAKPQLYRGAASQVSLQAAQSPASLMILMSFLALFPSLMLDRGAAREFRAWWFFERLPSLERGLAPSIPKNKHLYASRLKSLKSHSGTQAGTQAVLPEMWSRMAPSGREWQNAASDSVLVHSASLCRSVSLTLLCCSTSN